MILYRDLRITSEVAENLCERRLEGKFGNKRQQLAGQRRKSKQSQIFMNCLT
jgi:hypothetical protein